MAQINMKWPEGKSKAITLSYDDNVEQDVRLVEILNKYGLKATFNINSGTYVEEGTVFEKGRIHRRLSEKAATKLYTNSGHEIAAHGYTHPWLNRIPIALAMNDIIRDRETLEKQFDRLVRGFAYPYGTYNDEVVEALRMSGIVYARTVNSTRDFGIPQDWLRLCPTCHHDDPELMNLAEKFLKTEPNGMPYLFYLWGHSYEFESHNNWEVIEKFGEYISGKNEVWYATNIEIYDYVAAYNGLIFSVDGKRCRNTSSIPVWFTYDGKQYCVKSGETLTL